MNSSSSHYRGSAPAVLCFSRIAASNDCFRAAVWTGRQLQVTVMSIPVAGETGFRLLEDTDQLIRVESGCAYIIAGDDARTPVLEQRVSPGNSILVPAGIRHNVTNAGSITLRLCVTSAPPQFPAGMIQRATER